MTHRAEADRAPGPLAGLRILELARVIAGPYSGRILTDLGADVIKIEPPEGDQAREIAPKHDRGMSALFTFANVGKRSICLDLRSDAGREVALDLVRVCDAVTENFRPGVLGRLGLDWEAIHAANPRAVLLSINGYGDESRWRERRAYAPVLHAATGILDDQARYAGHPPAQINAAHGDTVAALHGAVALLAALRAAAASGVGERVEVPMFDAILSTYTEVGTALLPRPDDRRMNPLYSAGALGALAVAGPSHGIWHALVARADGPTDPTPPGADIPTKSRLRDAAIETWMAAFPSREALVAAVEEAGLACAWVDSLPDVLAGPMAAERALLAEVDDRRGGTRPVVRPPARFSRSSNRIRGPAPRRGEQSAEVLREVLGYDDERLAGLRAAGALIDAHDPDQRRSPFA